MEQILEMITTYGLETVAIALIINVLTGFVKMPIKSLLSANVPSVILLSISGFPPIR